MELLLERLIVEKVKHTAKCDDYYSNIVELYINSDNRQFFLNGLFYFLISLKLDVLNAAIVKIESCDNIVTYNKASYDNDVLNYDSFSNYITIKTTNNKVGYSFPPYKLKFLQITPYRTKQTETK